MSGPGKIDQQTIYTETNKFKVERYKYILNEIHFLNESVHKYLTLFQALATAVVGGVAAVYVGWRKLPIDVVTARIAIHALLGLLVILALFVVLSVIAGVWSWLDYRKEEVLLLDKVIEPGLRSPPNLRNFYRWSETYLVLFMLIVIFVACFFVELVIIPSIKP
jgi:hypothetical protein